MNLTKKKIKSLLEDGYLFDDIPPAGGLFEVVIDLDTKEIKRLVPREGVVKNTPCLIYGSINEIKQQVNDLQKQLLKRLNKMNEMNINDFMEKLKGPDGDKFAEEVMNLTPEENTETTTEQKLERKEPSDALLLDIMKTIGGVPEDEMSSARWLYDCCALKFLKRYNFDFEID